MISHICSIAICIVSLRVLFALPVIPETTRNDNSGFGLSMMKERIYLLSGKLEIISKPGEGCETIVTVPVKKEDN